MGRGAGKGPSGGTRAGTRAEAPDRALEAARRAIELRDRLVAVVGHDLRTPLAAIKMSLALLLRRRDLSPEQARIVARIGSSTVRMARLVRDLLDFSRLAREGSLPVLRRPADAASVVRTCLAELHAVHPQREIRLAAPASAIARIDSERVAQVVSNLVGNALQHGPRDARVDVAVEASDDEVAIRVHNAGPPISEDLSTLFEPFRSGAAAGETGTTGLGLFIVREVVRAHGGTVEVTSSEEEGTTFTVRLPRTSPTTGRPAPER